MWRLLKLRRPRRRTVLIGGGLLAGAAMNVAVAWVLVGAPDSWTRGGPVLLLGAGTRPSSPPLTAEQRRAVTQRLRPGAGGGLADDGSVLRGFGWTVARGWRIRGDDGDWAGLRIDGGWPMRSMAYIAVRRAPEAAYRYSPSLERPARLLPDSGWYRHPRDRVPLTPLLAGFAVNTLFYAGVLALPLTPLGFFPIRRWLRARQGRCVRCGYDLSGSTAAACPECGGVGAPRGNREGERSIRLLSPATCGRLPEARPGDGERDGQLWRR